jgi:O-antigen biosynthesis protein
MVAFNVSSDGTGEVNRPSPKPRLRTAFARSGEQSFVGFVVDLDDLTRKLTVEISVDGYPIRAILANAYVHELAKEGVSDGRFGFFFSLQDNILGNHTMIEARLANLGTRVGGPIELAKDTSPALDIDGPGMVRWLGGLRFSGWIGRAVESATASVLVDGVPVTRIRATGWSHIGSSAQDARPVRSFDFHLPERFADGQPHQLAVSYERGEKFGGSPIVFVAFANGFSELIGNVGRWGQADPRAVILEQLTPMSVPFAEYQRWRKRVPLSLCPPITSRFALIMVGSGGMADTLDSLHEQIHSHWVVASIPETSGTTCFQPEVAQAFLRGDGANCDFVVFGLAGTLFSSAALQRIAVAFFEFERAQAIYGDLDVVAADGSVWPLAFSAFDYERMLEQGYCAHLFALRRVAADRSLRAGASNLYRVFNSILDDGVACRADIVHLPGAVGTLPGCDYTTASSALAAATRAHLRQRGVRARVTQGSGSVLPAARTLRDFDVPATTIIIPIRNPRHLLQGCIESICPTISKHGAELIVVDNDSTDADAREYLAEIDGGLATVLRVSGPFNVSRLNNSAAGRANSKVLCFLSDSTKALDDDWLAEMLGRLAGDDVGAVGALRVWSSGVVEHGGIVLGPGFAAAQAFNDCIDGDEGYGDLLRVAHECSAVGGGCLVTRRDDYHAVGGMDDARFPVNFNEIDYCLKLRALGKRVVFTPHAKLLHLGSTSRRFHWKSDREEQLERELQNFRAKWGTILMRDPYYSPALSLDPIPFSALAWPARSMEARVNDSPMPTVVPPGF